MRRLRRTKGLRDLVRETDLSPRHLIQPLFVVAGEGVREPVESMPGIERFSISELVAEASELQAIGVESVILFGIPSTKDETGSGAYDDEGVVQLAVRALFPFDPALDAIQGALDAQGPDLLVPLLHTLAIALVYGALARLALRRFA